MSTLIRNVWVDGRWYGPDHGGDGEVTSDVARLVPADAWWPPREDVHAVADETAGQTAGTGVPAGPDTPVTYTVGARRDGLEGLGQMTRDQLVQAARERGIKVNPRGRVADIRETIYAAL